MIVDEASLPASSFGRPSGDLVIVYDGDCPFCSNFVALQKLRQNVGKVTLVNARDNRGDVREAKRAGLDLDQGMLVFWRGKIYEGGDAVNIMARLGADHGVMPKLSRALLSNPEVSRAIYPALRAGRNAALRLLGRTKLSD